MALTAKERRELLGQSHSLEAVATISAGELPDTVVAHIRRSFAGRALMKVRIHADSAAECDAAAVELVRRVPCELVKRIGRVVVLYRAGDDAASDASPDTDRA